MRNNSRAGTGPDHRFNFIDDGWPRLIPKTPHIAIGVSAYRRMLFRCL